MNKKVIESKFIKKYNFSNENGDAKIIVYEIYPGILVSYISVHMDVFDFELAENEIKEEYVGIHWCKEGRIEQETNNDFFYLMPGDCSIVTKDRQYKKYSFPTNHYHGLSISIETNKSMEYFSSLAKSLDIGPSIIKYLCDGKRTRVLRSIGEIEGVFLDIYSIPEEQRIDYLKIKLHELFYKLKYIDLEGLSISEITVPKSKVEFVKKVSKYLTNHINDKITLSDLTFHFSVSDTYLQNAFKQVYGMPVISFIRSQKMQCAAKELINTDKSISDIAEEYGYENESKFSAMFKKIIGDTPSVYRKEHSKIRIL